MPGLPGQHVQRRAEVFEQPEVAFTVTHPQLRLGKALRLVMPARTGRFASITWSPSSAPTTSRATTEVCGPIFQTTPSP